MPQMTVDFGLEKTTKNTYRFQELDANGNVAEWSNVKIGSIYVQKSFFNGVEPRKIKVTVEA